jgi:hypothetical protein
MRLVAASIMGAAIKPQPVLVKINKPHALNRTFRVRLLAQPRNLAAFATPRDHDDARAARPWCG